MIVNGQLGLIELNLESTAGKPCFHCSNPLDWEGATFLWMGVDPLVMHILCLADWLRRAQKDRDKFFGVNADASR